jgi:hypothetical protein
MTRGQRILLWVAGLPAILVGLILLVGGGECTGGSSGRSPACMGAEQLILIVILLGGGVFAPSGPRAEESRDRDLPAARRPVAARARIP